MQTALPIMFTILIAVWVNNKSIDGIHRRLDDMRNDIVKRPDRIEGKLDDHDRRITRVEERTSPLRG